MSKPLPKRVTKQVLDCLHDDGVTPPVVRFLSDHFDQYDDHLLMLRQIFILDQLDRDRVGRDAWSQGQLRSKHWLLSELGKFNLSLGTIWIACGWIGTLALMMQCYRPKLRLQMIRSFDIDDRCALLADTLNKPWVLDDWRFKASTLDVCAFGYSDFEYDTVRYDGSVAPLIETPDTIINTSCEHLHDFDDWFSRIPNGRLVILQCSSHESHDGHVNSMQTVYDLAARTRCSRVFFKGTLDCGDYLRHMLIGRK